MTFLLFLENALFLQFDKPKSVNDVFVCISFRCHLDVTETLCHVWRGGKFKPFLPAAEIKPVSIQERNGIF